MKTPPPSSQRAAVSGDRRPDRSGSDPAAERLRRILDLLPPVAYWDTELRNRAANAAFANFFELAPEAIEGRRIDEVLWKDLYELALPHLERMLATGEPQQFDRTTVDKLGMTRHAQVQLYPDLIDGELRGVVAIATDVTGHREAELALAASQTRFGLLLAAPVGIATLHPNGRLMLINPALAGMLGYPIAELQGCWLSELLTAASTTNKRDQVERLLSGELGSASLECELVRKDGQPITVILSVGTLAADPTRDVVVILALQDISDRKQAEDALRASQQRLEQAEQIAATGTWEWDLRSGRVSWSSGLYRIFMLEAQDLAWDFEAGIAQHVLPADREALREALQRAVTERSAVTLEVRVIRADSRVRVLEAQAEVVVDDDGEPVRMIALVHDVTEARLAQQALESASSQLADRARELQQLTVGSPVGSQAQGRRGPPEAELTERQVEVLQLVAQGLTNASIAQRLFISETTVKWHIRQILSKTNSSNRAEAVARVLGARNPRD